MEDEFAVGVVGFAAGVGLGGFFEWEYFFDFHGDCAGVDEGGDGGEGGCVGFDQERGRVYAFGLGGGGQFG